MSKKEEPRVSPEMQKRLDDALDELLKKKREEEEKCKKRIIQSLKENCSDDRPFSY